MPGARSLGFSLLLLAAAACRPTTESQAPKPLKPEDGPNAYISVNYDGGLLNRSLRAVFRTEQTSYVLVGHLAGDGRIRVLFPESPDESGLIRGTKYYRTSSTTAHYDALPSLFSFTRSPYRGVGAMHDSYDGAGHGYVFIVASRTPLDYDLLYDYAGWAELEMDGYDRHHDPRFAIRSFADALTRGAKYTLKFASSMTSTSYYSYAMRSWDCSVMSSLGMFAHPSMWSVFSSSLFGYRRTGFGYCDNLSPMRTPRYAVGPVFTAAPSLDPTVPTASPAPSLDRPGRRGFGPRSDTPTRTTLTRVSPSMPAGDRNSLDRNRTRRPAYGTTRGRAADSDPFPSRSSASERRSRDANARPSRPSDRRSSGSSSGGASSGSGSSVRASERPSSSGSSSSGTRAERPSTSSPRGEAKKPDSQR